jgi:hypothetical protein
MVTLRQQAPDLEAGAGVITNSDAIRICARHLQSGYVKILLEFVPDFKKRQAINNLDIYVKSRQSRIAAESDIFSYK